MEDKHYAVLIDADNISHNYVEIVFNEVSKMGLATVRRIYGDWCSDYVKGWKEANLKYSLMPVQQYAYTTGKNSTDSAMIIDAMDLLYTADVNGFCLISSDSDFTRLAQRLREAGKEVIGMGMQHTPSSFVKACTDFKFLDLISDTEYEGQSSSKEDSKSDTVKEAIKAEEGGTPSAKKPKTKKSADKPVEPGPQPEMESSQTPFDKLKEATLKIIESGSDDSGWILASDIGMVLKKQFPDFDPRNYGEKKLVPLLEKMGLQIKKYEDKNNIQNPSLLVYVRIPDKKL